jgi:hypothetical protein
VRWLGVSAIPGMSNKERRDAQENLMGNWRKYETTILILIPWDIEYVKPDTEGPNNDDWGWVLDL